MPDVRDDQIPAGAGSAGEEVFPVASASVIVLRGDPFEVLLLRRHERAGFVPGSWVFPGGIAEEGDRELAGHLGPGDRLTEMRVCAARELFEETGVWIGSPFPDALECRRRLLDGSSTFEELMERCRPELDRLVWTARWITPVGIPRRYDTWFFLTTVSEDVEGTPEYREGTEIVWLRPEEALARHEAGDLPLVFPTIRTLQDLTKWSSAEELLRSRRGAEIPTTRPGSGHRWIAEADRSSGGAMTIRVLLAANPGPYTLDGTRTYLVGDDTVIDPGPAMEEHVSAILANLPGLATILLTHRHADHAGAAPMLKARSGARLLTPSGVLDDLADEHLTDGEVLEVGDVRLEVIATPGHTAEHVCFLTADGELFTGDTILGQGTTTIFPPDGDMGAYLQSLERLLSRRPVRIYPGHGPVRHDAEPLIDEYLYHRRMREQEVVEALKAGVGTVREMRRRIYPNLDPRLEEASELQIRAHLDLLRQNGRVREDEAGRYQLV